MREADPWRALVKNALAAERANTRPRARRTQVRRTYEPPVIPAWAREEYDCLFGERRALYAEAGVCACDDGASSFERVRPCEPGCLSHLAALSELGCLEFWAYVNGHESEDVPMRVAA